MPDVDPKKIKLDVQPTKLSFVGYSESKKSDYAVELEFFKEIDPSASKINHSPRAVEMVLQKKELEEEYWPRLLKDKSKVHFLKTDFDKVGQASLTKCDYVADVYESGSTRTSKMLSLRTTTT